MPTNLVAPSVNPRDLGIVCIWTLLGLVLTALFAVGPAAALGQALALAG